MWRMWQSWLLCSSSPSSYSQVINYLHSSEIWFLSGYLHGASSFSSSSPSSTCLPLICWKKCDRYFFSVGFFIRTSLIPVFLRWAQYLCAIKYAINLVLLTEFNPTNKSCQGDAGINCMNVLLNNDVRVEDAYIYILVIFALFILFRITGAVILIKKARRFINPTAEYQIRVYHSVCRSILTTTNIVTGSSQKIFYLFI